METKHMKELWRVVARAGREKMQGSFDTKREAEAFIAFWPAVIQAELRVTGPHSVGLDTNTCPPADWLTMENYRRELGLWTDPAAAPAPMFSFDPVAFLADTDKALKELSILPEGQEAIPQAVALAAGFTTALASIADSLQRIAKAQETQIALAQIDIDQTIEQAAQQIAEERAAKLVKAQTERNYIGGKNIT